MSGKHRPHRGKDEISRRVTAAIGEIAQLPKEAIWVVFEDVTAEDWYVGGTTVAELKKQEDRELRQWPHPLQAVSFAYRHAVVPHHL